MKIIPLAAESMGSRSMATFVETRDSRILIDPGANLGPLRYSLSPHPLEQWFLKKHRERIHLFAQSSEIIIITHYHFDHFIPDVTELYKDKILLLKNPNRHINTNQRNRAFEFLKRIEGLTKEISYIDGRNLNFGKTQIVSSPPFYHGATQKMGFIIQITLHEGEKTFLFSSDIQGLSQEDSVAFILNQNPDILYLDGPVTYLKENSSTEEVLKKTLREMKTIVKETRLRNIIIDHHLLRDLRWKEKINSFLESDYKKDVVIQTAAEYRGEENNLLEARRRHLYENDPPKRQKES